MPEDVDWRQQALSDPRGTLSIGRRKLDQLSEAESEQRSEILRAMSMASRAVGDVQDSIEFARRAAAIAESAGHNDQRLMALLTMSGSLAMSGDIAGALSVIDQGIDSAVDDHLRARFFSQRGAVLANTGRIAQALEAFSTALPIFQHVGDQFSIGLTLNHLGRLSTERGDFDQARGYLIQALRLAEEREEWASVHGIQHNLGMLEAYRGDIPTALKWLEESDRLFMKTAEATAPQHVARAEVLISAGLFEEALSLSRRIAEASRERDDKEHLYNALMVAARAALLAGDTALAGELADDAAAAVGTGEGPLSADAEAVSTEARYIDSGATPALLRQARRLASRLQAEGLMIASGHAHFLVARIAGDLGHSVIRHEALSTVAGIRSGPFEFRIQRALARALLNIDANDRGSALRSIRSGLRVLERYQSVLGATDMRMGLERHGSELADLGLDLALASGRPRAILEWLDRTRARALRFRPVVTSDDPNEELLARLRRIESELRKPASRTDRGLLQERRSLQDEIARKERLRRGTDVAESAFDTRRMVSDVGTGSLIELGVKDGSLLGVQVSRGRASRMMLGPIEPVEIQLRQLRFGMRRAARLGRAFDYSVLGALDDLLLGQWSPGEDAVVVVPPPSLMAVPWAGLPRLRGRPVTVAPSSEIWWQARHRTPAGETIVIAGGPDLLVAEDEVRRVAKLHKTVTTLLPGATVEEVRVRIDGAWLAHIACHATFSVENPMFSALRLGDGDLNVYDIERLQQPPSLVVLSACDSGYTEARAGSELAGLTSALLSMGTRTVIASVGLVPDSPATSDLMVDFHGGLVAGLEPAKALAAAQEKAFDDPERFVSAASFICVGA